jgi:hypothetical protein
MTGGVRAEMRQRRRSGRGPTPGLVRVHLPPSGRAAHPRSGFRATARLPGGSVERLFLDTKEGGETKARAAAVAWRRAQLTGAGLPDPERRRVVLKSRSESGIVGVHQRADRGVWVATYETEMGKRLARGFSVRQHGPEKAKTLAIAQRRAWEREHLGVPLPVVPSLISGKIQ